MGRLGAGFVDALTFVPSTFILGAIFGASTGPAGISQPAAILMSAIVWSGASQFAALPLWPEGGGVVILSALALSLRFSLITASMTPLLVNYPRWLRAALAYCVADETYALAVTRRRAVSETYDRTEHDSAAEGYEPKARDSTAEDSRSKEHDSAAQHSRRTGHAGPPRGATDHLEPGYLVGSWIPMYAAWFLGTVLGVLVGAQVPPDWIEPLKAVFPLVFLVLTVLLCTSVALALVAVLGGVLSVLGAVSEGLTARLRPWLRYVAPAVLGAFVAPAVLAPGGHLVLPGWHLLAYLASFAVAIATRRMVPALAAGLAALVLVTLIPL